MPNPVLQRYVDERTQTQENIDRILDRANEEERDLTESERELINGHRERLQQLEPMIGELLEVEETRNKAKDARGALARRREPSDDDKPDGDGEPAKPDGEYKTFAQYARDVMLTRFSQIGATVDPHVRHRAGERLTHHRAVEKVLTTDVPGLLQPQYIAQIMQVINQSRPIVDSGRMLNLTSGKIQYPRVTTRPQVAKQPAEKTEAGDGTMTVIMVEKVASTFISSANFSWQTIQWSNPDALALWFDLAGESYAKQTDADAGALLTVAGGLGTPPVAVASDDLAGWMAAIAAAAGQVYTATGRFADTFWASPDLGYGLLGLVSAEAPTFLAVGQGNLATGSFPPIGGLQFVVSAGLGTGTAVVGDSQALLCAETAGAPVDLRAVEPSIGGMEVGVIGAFLSELIEEAAFVPLTPPAAP
ncbi:MAG TPA: phage major capsid protein [Gaiellales bacterium]|nr:phage major capsid protein [Gaiellales bacterium]